MGKVNTSQFRPIKFDFGKIHISGGHSLKSFPVTSKQITSASGEHITFVKVATSENWLLLVTTGCGSYAQSAFGRTSLLESLRAKVIEHCDGRENYSECAPEIGQDDGDHDPMAEVEADSAVAEGDDPKIVKNRGLKRTRYYTTHRRNTVVRFNMPVRCPEEEPHCKETRTVRMYIADRKQLWLDLHDLDWCVRFLYVQNHLKGVPMVDDDSAGPGCTD